MKSRWRGLFELITEIVVDLFETFAMTPAVEKGRSEVAGNHFMEQRQDIDKATKMEK